MFVSRLSDDGQIELASVGESAEERTMMLSGSQRLGD
jgi:hypothetical protein